MAYEDPPCLAGHTHTLTHTQSKSLGYEDINGISGHQTYTRTQMFQTRSLEDNNGLAGHYTHIHKANPLVMRTSMVYPDIINLEISLRNRDFVNFVIY